MIDILINFLKKTSIYFSTLIKCIFQGRLNRLRPVQKFVMTLTADNGKEVAYHEQVSQSLETNFYFATLYHSWERGLNEHTNGLVRQYLPKNKRFDEVSGDSLKEIEKLLNNRPRKVLDVFNVGGGV